MECDPYFDYRADSFIYNKKIVLFSNLKFTTMNTPVIIQFLQELINRLGKKNPTFFKIFSWIGAAASIVSGLPEVIMWLGVKNLPDWFTFFENKAVGIAGIVMFVMANLTVNTNNIPEVKKPTVLPLTTKKDGI